MRNAFLIAAGSALLLLSCNSEKSGKSDRAKKNLDAMHAVNDAIASGDIDKVDAYFAPDIMDYAGYPVPKKGIDSVKADLKMMTSGMENIKSEILHEGADDEYAFIWIKHSGKLKTDMMGKKAGETVEGEAIEMARFNAEGKAVEHWTFMELREMMKMMGGGMPMADTTKMPPPPPPK